MLIHELTAAECRQILSRVTLARLACARGGQPYIVPISFAFDAESDCLFGFSSIGRKVEWMRGNPSVCVEVEDVEDRFHWTTLVSAAGWVSSSWVTPPIGRRMIDFTATPERRATRA